MTAAAMQLQDRRHEVKLVLPATQLHRVEMWLRLHEAQFAPHYPPRWVNSMYFDTEEFAAFHEAVEGDCRRMKARLRWYGCDIERFDDSTLEFKCKRGPIGWKRGCPIHAPFDLGVQTWREVVGAIGTATPVDLRVMFDQARRPALINRYYRMYYLSLDGVIRITVDCRITSWPQSTGLRPNLRWSAWHDDRVVMEFKASEHGSHVLVDAINAMGGRIEKFSKYTNGLAGCAW